MTSVETNEAMSTYCPVPNEVYGPDVVTPTVAQTAGDPEPALCITCQADPIDWLTLYSPALPIPNLSVGAALSFPSLIYILNAPY